MPQHLSLLLQCPLVIAAIFICGIGGTFHYGFSLAVMTSPSAYIQELVNTTCRQRYNISLEHWQLSLIWSFIVSTFCLGGLLGSLISGHLSTKFGRKRCLMLNNCVAIAGALMMFFSQTAMSFEMILVGRLLYGINAGISFTIHAMYLVECAPKRLQVMVGVTVSTFVSFGKLSGQLLGIRDLLGTPDRWPWLLGFNGFAALLQLSTLPLLPESPKFLLLNKGDRQACEKALKRLWGNKDHSVEVEEMLKEKIVHSHSVIELIKDPTVRWQLLTIIVTFTTLQLCGVNAVYFYSFDVFRTAGIQEDQLSYAALGMGLCEFLTSVSCVMVIGKIGKKVLLISGYTGISVTLILLTVTLYFENQFFWIPYCSMVLIFIFIFFVSGGAAAATAALPGEIFTQSYKSAGYVIATSINWMGLFLLGMLFPLLVENLNSFCFLIFLLFCVTCVLFVRFAVPETKNRTALEIAAEFQKMHSKTNKEKSGQTVTTALIYETRL